MNIKLKNASNVFYTKQLFYEPMLRVGREERVFESAPFSLYTDRPGTVNFGKQYVALGDSSGYKITQALLGGDYKHWLTLMKCVWFKEAKEIWDRELEAKLYAEGLATIKEIAGDELHKGRLQAAKILLDKGGSTSKMDSKRGRPTKLEVEGLLRQEAGSAKELEDDMARIRLING